MKTGTFLEQGHVTVLVLTLSAPLCRNPHPNFAFCLSVNLVVFFLPGTSECFKLTVVCPILLMQRLTVPLETS